MAGMLLVGSDHQLAPPSRLEELSLRREQILAGLLEHKSHGGIRGGVVLSTCNRFELLLDVDAARDRPADFLGFQPTVPLHRLADAAAVEFLLGVASGLHSVAFGEEQILGQVREAFKRAEELGLLSRDLHRLRARLMAGARSIRHGTGLDQRPRSVAAMAVDQVLAAGGRVAVVGAGPTARLVLEILQHRRAGPALVVNRTLARAEALARHFGGSAMALSDFLAGGHDARCAVLAISAGGPVLTPATAGGLHTVVDVSQPSVVAPELARDRSRKVLTLDDLARLAADEHDQYTKLKAAAMAAVQSLAPGVWAEVAAPSADAGRVVDLHVEGALAELERAFRGRLGNLHDADRDAIRDLLLRAVKRNAHYHVQDIRRLAVAP